MRVFVMLITFVVIVVGRKESIKDRNKKVESDYMEEEYAYLASNAPPTLGRDENELPHHDDLLGVARYIVHTANTVSLATICSHEKSLEYPCINMKAMADGPYNQSTGIPYFLMSFTEFFAHDLKKNSRSSIAMSVKPQVGCLINIEDEEDPACAIVSLSGKIKKVNENTTEYKFAMNSLFERHPEFSGYPSERKWFITKLKIAQVALMDSYGEADYIPVSNYLSYKYTGPFMRVTTAAPSL